VFSVFPLDRANWEGIRFAPDGDPASGTETLAFNPRERSIDYTYKGPLPIRFFRAVPGPEGETLFQPVGAVGNLPRAVDDEGGRIILFFEQGGENADGPYTVHSMLDNAERFPNESIVFFNTMDVTFLGILGDNRIQLPPGASAPVNVGGYFDTPVPIAMAIRDNDDLHLVVRNKILFSPQRRTLMILRPPRNARSLRIRTQRLTEFTGERATGEEELQAED
jgi:hypothetical protein